MAQAEKLFFVGIKLLIVNEEGKLLLLRADVVRHRISADEYWDIPGGRVQHGESERETLIREVQEELGDSYTVEHEKYVTTVISNHEIPTDAGPLAGLALRIWRMDVPNDLVPALSREHLAYEWVNKEIAAELLAHKYPPEFCTLIEAGAW